jgi:transketolase
MGLAPVAHVLFTRFFKFDPKNPKWVHGVLLTALI